MSTVVTKNLQIGADGTEANNFTVYQPAAPDGTLRIGNGNSGTTSAQVVLTSAGNVGIGTSSPTHELTVSGSLNCTSNLFVGATTTSLTDFGAKFLLTDTASVLLAVHRQASNGDVARFGRGGLAVGSISVTAAATSYNTSSDYRLKHDIAPMTGALAKVAALKPCTYKWNADNSANEGFIAHELAEVCPSAVSGEKDAVNEDGSIKPQGIDTSFLVATLTAAIQEQQAIIAQLQADVALLKGAPE